MSRRVLESVRSRTTRLVGALVDASGRRPLVVLALALCALAGTWHFALKVLSDPHTDLLEQVEKAARPGQ